MVLTVRILDDSGVFMEAAEPGVKTIGASPLGAPRHFWLPL